MPVAWLSVFPSVDKIVIAVEPVVGWASVEFVSSFAHLVDNKLL